MLNYYHYARSLLISTKCLFLLKQILEVKVQFSSNFLIPAGRLRFTLNFLFYQIFYYFFFYIVFTNFWQICDSFLIRNKLQDQQVSEYFGLNCISSRSEWHECTCKVQWSEKVCDLGRAGAQHESWGQKGFFKTSKIQSAASWMIAFLTKRFIWGSCFTAFRLSDFS